MATATHNGFNQFLEDLANKVHDLSSDSIQLYLTNATPVATDTVKATAPAEIATGNGYTGPFSLASVTSTQTTGTYTFGAADPGTIVTATGAVAQFRHVVLFNTTPAATPTDPLIAWWDYGAAIDMTSGETFSMTWSTASTILQIA